MTNKIKYYDQFRPLTGVEIEENRPLFFRIDKKLILEFMPWTAQNVYNFWIAKDRITDYIAEGKDVEKTGQIVVGFVAMIDLIWDMRENKRFFDRWRYKKFKDFCLRHTNKLLELFDDLANFQTRLFFLAEKLQKLGMVQSVTYSKIHTGQSLTDSIPIPKHTSALQAAENWKKKKLSIKT